MVLAACRNTESAAFLSPASMAFRVFLTALRNSERREALCWRRFSDWRARLRADAMLAIDEILSS
jgi:hypothetical protein